MHRFVFVILHYKAIQDTLECIESVLNNSASDDYSIVVVDNGSNDGTGNEIKKRYIDNEKVSVLISEENLGFAKGNNLGCNYAKEHFDPDFLIVINNDTIIEQTDFLSRISEEYNRSSFDVLGPDIIARDNKHQNPCYLIPLEIGALKRKIFLLRIYYFLTYIHLFRILRYLKKKMIKDSGKNSLNESNGSLSHKERIQDVPLHGSALIFSRKYMKQFDYIFYGDTFLYAEEDFLNYRRIKYNLMFVYNPQLKIYHKEDASTDFILDSSRSKRLFIFKHSSDSQSKLLKKLKSE